MFGISFSNHFLKNNSKSTLPYFEQTIHVCENDKHFFSGVLYGASSKFLREGIRST